MLELVLSLMLVADAERRFVIETTPRIDTDREIVPIDATLFGVDQAYAHRMIEMARQHRSFFCDEVKSWNSPLRHWQWERECDWRSDCWYQLSRSLEPNAGRWESYSYRLDALYRLRDLIGHEAFYAGQMPSPIPQYRLPNR